MRKTQNLLFIICCFFSAFSFAQCPPSIPGYTLLGEFNDSKYFVSDASTNWQTASANALTIGGYLASIESQEENDFLQQNISTVIFIGINDAQTEGTLEWDSGEPVSYTNISGINSSSNDFGKMNFWNGAWGFDNQFVTRKYIVEIPCGNSGGGLQVDCDFGLPPVIIPTDPAGEIVSWNIPTATTDCAGGVVVEQTAGPPPGSFFDAATTTTITYTITDQCGNTETCSASIQVNFLVGELICPDDITVEATSANGAVVFFDDAVPSPTGCIPGPPSVIDGLPSGSEFPIGTTEVQFLSFFAGSNTYCQIGQVCSFNVTVMPQGGGGGCPEEIVGFTALGEFGDSKYYISDDVSRPTDAQAVAESHGGYLAVISSQAENDFVQQGADGLTYIGLNDVDTEGDLVWVNGEPLIYNNVNPCSFCEQNADNQDFVVIQPWDGGWSFSNFWNQRKYIMEVPCDGGSGGGITVADCSADINLVGTEGNNYSGTATWNIPTATTDCPNGGLQITQIEGPPSGSEFFPIPSGTPVVYQITDACGNEEFCIFFVYVNPESPVLVCPDDITVTATSATGAIVNYDFPTLISFCGLSSNLLNISPDLPSGSEFPIGTTTVFLTGLTTGPAAYCQSSISCSFDVTVLPDGGGCPTSLPGYTSLGEYNGSAYFLSQTAMRAVDAQAEAENLGGHLAVIQSQAENDFLYPQIDGVVYIGLNDYTTEGELEWFNGESVSYTNFDICSFCEENSEEQDFVMMHSWNGGWSWSGFYNSRPFIVEIPCSAPLNNSNNVNLLLLQDEGYFGKPLLQKVMPNPATDFVFVEIKLGKEERIALQVFDTFGKVVHEKIIELPQGKHRVRLDTSTLPGGIYNIHVPQAQRNFSSLKFVKTRM